MLQSSPPRWLDEPLCALDWVELVPDFTVPELVLPVLVLVFPVAEVVFLGDVEGDAPEVVMPEGEDVSDRMASAWLAIFPSFSAASPLSKNASVLSLTSAEACSDDSRLWMRRRTLLVASESPRAKASAETLAACAAFAHRESPPELVMPRPALSFALGVAPVDVPVDVPDAPWLDERLALVPAPVIDVLGLVVDELGVVIDEFGLVVEVDPVPGTPDCGSKHPKVPAKSSCAVTCDSDGFDIADGAGGGFSSALEG